MTKKKKYVSLAIIKTKDDSTPYNLLDFDGCDQMNLHIQELIEAHIPFSVDYENKEE